MKRCLILICRQRILWRNCWGLSEYEGKREDFDLTLAAKDSRVRISYF